VTPPPPPPPASARAARWLESAAVAAAAAVFAVTAAAPALSLVLVAAALLPALTSRRLPLGTNGQLFLTALALASAWTFATIRTEGPPAGAHALHPVVAGAALFGLLLAIPRLALAEPWGGRRATAAGALFSVIACGGALHGAVYPATAALYGLTQLAALATLDPGRAPWRRLSRRARRDAALLAALAVAVLAALVATLPPLHDLAVAGIRSAFARSRTGFGLHLELGSLRGLLVSDDPVLRVTGPAPPLLRGVVYDRYLRAGWTVRGGAWPRPLAPPAADDGAPLPRDVTEIRTLSGARDRFFLPLDATAIVAPGEGLRADAFGIVYPVREEGARRVRFRAGPRAGAPAGVPAAPPLAPPSETDRSVPDDDALHAALDARVAAWGLAADDVPGALRTLRARFQQEFRYSLEFDTRRGVDPVVDFLDRRAGHCEYFAATAALLLRRAGVPARVVGGFRVTERNPVGGFHVVRESNAHAWVEVWRADHGAWETFDPTPAGPLAAHMAARTSWLGAGFDALVAWIESRVDGLPSPSPTDWLVFGVVPLLAVFVWSRWRTRRRTAARAVCRAAGRYGDPLPAIERLLAVLAERGAARPASEPLEAFAARLAAAAALAPDGPAAAALLRDYVAWRYGGVGDPAAIGAAVDGWLVRGLTPHPARRAGSGAG
jgi:transglutaminase-like putative cysteine protease